MYSVSKDKLKSQWQKLNSDIISVNTPSLPARTLKTKSPEQDENKFTEIDKFLEVAEAPQSDEENENTPSERNKKKTAKEHEIKVPNTEEEKKKEEDEEDKEDEEEEEEEEENPEEVEVDLTKLGKRSLKIMKNLMIHLLYEEKTTQDLFSEVMYSQNIQRKVDNRMRTNIFIIISAADFF